MSGGFQTAVANQPAIGVAGDFASLNPYFTYDMGPGGAVAGAAGVTIGRFAWAVPPVDGDGAPATVNSFGFGPVTGFVPRVQQGLITVYLADSSMVIPQGFQMTLMIGGDFFVKNDGATQAVPGQKAYADFATGKVSFAATGTPATGASATGSSIAASTFSTTGSITNDILTVTAVGSGTVVPGATIAGGATASGTMITSQVLPLISGEALGGVGRYLLSIPEQTVASRTITGTYGTLTIGTATGTFAIGNLLTVSGAVVAGTYITANITGAGGTGGTMVVNNNTVVTSQTISVAATNVETKFVAMSSGLAGELVKISDHPLG